MKGFLSRQRLALASAGLAVVVALAFAGVALGTDPIKGGPPDPTKTTLADVTVLNTVNVNVDPIKLRTKDQVEVAQFANTAQHGFSSGWHMHTGPVLITVTAGELTFYEADCTMTRVSAGHGYIEATGQPILAHNEGAGEVDWITTQIIPVGGHQRDDVNPGFCGLL